MLVTLGYSGWAAGQLEDEIEPQRLDQRRAPSPAIIFDTPVDERYDKALSLLGIDAGMLSSGGGARMSAAPCAPPHPPSAPFSLSISARARVGVASGNSLTAQRDAAAHASPRRARRASTRSRALIAEWQPDALVVGVPFHPDGAAHDNTERARRFARQLQAASACRCTRSTSATRTTEAQRRRRARPRRRGRGADPRAVPGASACA